MSYLFYARRFSVDFTPEAGSWCSEYKFTIWRPRAGRLVPCGLSILPYAVWWAFHYLHVFSNRDYAIAVVYDGGHLIHRSCVFPSYFRFPFMGKDDLQIGDTWTHPNYRGQGLATAAIQKVIKSLQSPGRIFWYVVEQENKASIRVVEKAGFELFGKGIRIKRFGVGMLGAFVIQHPVLSCQ